MKRKIYQKINSCRICKSKSLNLILNLGKQPPANSLIKSLKDKINKVPLRLVMCNYCKTIQIQHTVDPSYLFTNYFWVTGTSIEIKKYSKFFFKQIYKRIKNFDKKFIVEIASNDGTILKEFKKSNFKVLGVDPAKNIAQIANKKKIKTIPSFFNSNLARNIIKNERQKPICLIARNIIPHINNIHDVIKGIELLLDEEGIGAIEFHHNKNIIKKLHYDYIYHEHLFYFSIFTISRILKSYNLNCFDIFKSPISGGSLVILFSKKKKEVSINLKKMINQEKRIKLNSLSTWKKLSQLCKIHKKKLLLILNDIQNKKKIVIGYGASARSSTLINFLKLNNSNIAKIIDQNPLKHNKFTSGSKIHIIPPKKNIIIKSEIIIIFAWNFKDEIVDFLKHKIKFKGKIIIPLPKIQTVFCK